MKFVWLAGDMLISGLQVLLRIIGAAVLGALVGVFVQPFGWNPVHLCVLFALAKQFLIPNYRDPDF